MKRIYTLLALFIFVVNSGYAQKAPDWAWAKGAGGTHKNKTYINANYSNGIALDAASNIYISGFFVGSNCVFDSTDLINNDSLHHPNNMFVAKYSPNGKLHWVARNRGTGDANTQYRAITTDIYSNVYVTGTYINQCIFGKDTLTSAGTYIVKYDSSGKEIWVKGLSGYIYISSIVTDAHDNLLITGFFIGGHVVFYDDSLKNDTLNQINGSDIFTAKYDSKGHLLWAKSAGGTNSEGAYGIAVDASDNIYIVGVYNSSPCVFTNDTLYNTNLSGYVSNIFVAKYNTNGKVLWAKSAGGDQNDEAKNITIDVKNNIYVTGSYNDTCIFGKDTIVHKTGGSFITKYDTSGNVIWVKADSINQIVSLSTDALGNLFTGGNMFRSTYVFGTDTILCKGSDDILITKYNSNGKPLWAKNTGANYWNPSVVANAAVVNPFGQIYITGVFYCSEMFFGTTTLHNNPYMDSTNRKPYIFLAKLDTASSTSTNITNIEALNTLKIYPNPTTKQFTILLPMPNADITITDDIGRPILHTKAIGNKAILQLDNAGLYFIQSQSGTQSMTQKLVVIKN